MQVDCSPMIDLEAFQKVIEDGVEEIDEQLFRGAMIMVMEFPEWVWKDAEVGILGVKKYYLFYSGSRTNKFVVHLNEQNQIIKKLTDHGWGLTFRKGWQSLKEYAIPVAKLCANVKSGGLAKGILQTTANAIEDSSASRTCEAQKIPDPTAGTRGSGTEYGKGSGTEDARAGGIEDACADHLQNISASGLGDTNEGRVENTSTSGIGDSSASGIGYASAGRAENTVASGIADISPSHIIGPSACSTTDHFARSFSNRFEKLPMESIADRATAGVVQRIVDRVADRVADRIAERVLDFMERY